MKANYPHLLLLLFGALQLFCQQANAQTYSPYQQELVRFSSADATLSGTLIYPNGVGQFPAAILISGSGPDDRDQNIMGFKSFELLADHLCKNGIAVLRFDDRGHGESTGPSVWESSNAQIGEDVLAAFRLLESHPSIQRDHIGLIGHAEGGMIAPSLAADFPEIDFVVMLASPVLSGRETLNMQLELVMAEDGATPIEIDQAVAQQELFFNAISTGEGWDEIRKNLFMQSRAILEADTIVVGQTLHDTIEYLLTQTEAAIAAYDNLWFRYFISQYPTDYLGRVRAPILALFAEHDLQVDAQQHMPLLIETLELGGSNDFQVETIPNANHLFQPCTSGSPSKYATNPKSFAPGLLESVTSWIKLKTSY